MKSYRGKGVRIVYDVVRERDDAPPYRRMRDVSVAQGRKSHEAEVEEVAISHAPAGTCQAAPRKRVRVHENGAQIANPPEDSEEHVNARGARKRVQRDASVISP